MEEFLANKNPKLSLARLEIDMLPERLMATNSSVTHITVLDLKHNRLQLLPCELFLCLTQLEELDVSQVSKVKHQPVCLLSLLNILWRFHGRNSMELALELHGTFNGVPRQIFHCFYHEIFHGTFRGVPWKHMERSMEKPMEKCVIYRRKNFDLYVHVHK